MAADAQDISVKITRPFNGESLTIARGSTFVIGVVSPPGAEVTVNGAPADVSEDGAFIAMAPIQRLPAPQRVGSKQVDAVIECVVRVGDKELRRRVVVATPSLGAPKEPPVEQFAVPPIFEVTEEQILSQTGTNHWGLLYLPKGARVKAVSERGANLKLPLGQNGETWVSERVLIAADSLPATSVITVTNLSPTETRIHVGAIVPYSIRQQLTPAQLHVTVHAPTGDRSFEIASLSSRPWGFASRYENTTLIVTQRTPPDLSTGLHGKIVCVDPGHHPDTGAVGPRGLTERDANLKISLALEKLLTDAGARVVFTRRSEPLPLRQRRGVVLQFDADIFVSVHNNSVPDGTDPRTNYGTSTFYYHPQSRDLAASVHDAMLRKLGFPDQAVNQKSLYVCRISELPAILVEPTYIILPDHEWLLLTEEGQQKVAESIFEGIRDYFEALK